ncbi:hypothetical protein [Deinococcus arcticus]|uniref:Uncharacterized protein n=1 Tax=Deinococcus arcticus TaxID=2136176 RepID=A0A2T3W533_9DEIO|nr:hypothetical protein [Deinococcus arcticus]PTA66998.1 hypothetical protein C8263_14900 [Deinococcus arcticus]
MGRAPPRGHLTTGAEDNLLKLAELRGMLTAEQTQRWAAIKADYRRNKAMGGNDADTGRTHGGRAGRYCPGTAGAGHGAGAGPPRPASGRRPARGPGPLSARAGTRPPGTAPQLAGGPTAPDDAPLRAALAPLLAGLAATTQKQDQTNAAIYELVEVIRKRQSVVRGAPVPFSVTGRHPQDE